MKNIKTYFVRIGFYYNGEMYMSRFDYFMIWGNGYDKALDIVDEIRKDENFIIHAIIRKKFETSTENFIKNVYVCDTVPWPHLVAKSRYLLKYPPRVVFVFVTNKNPDERWYGEGVFGHIQCKKVKDLKEAIRNKFNPRRPDGTRTEEHVIHSSDYETQVDHTLKVLGLQTKEKFIFKPNPAIDTSPYLSPFNFDVQEVSLNDLLVSHVNAGCVPVEQSFHYGYVTGDFQAKKMYEDYWNTHWGIFLLEDHSPQAFDRLINRFEYSGQLPNLIVVRREGNKYRILDGAHRAAILLSKGFDKVNVAVIQ